MVFPVDLSRTSLVAQPDGGFSGKTVIDGRVIRRPETILIHNETIGPLQKEWLHVFVLENALLAMKGVTE